MGNGKSFCYNYGMDVGQLTHPDDLAEDGNSIKKLLYEGLPIVCFSANMMDVSDRQESEGLFVDYLTKPIHIKTLLQVLSKYL